MGEIAAIRRRAGELRAQAADEGWPPDRLAAAVVEACGVSRLAAYRLSCGWTLKQVAERLNALRGTDDRRITVQMVCDWEHGKHTPGPRTSDLLCRLYLTRPDRLGYGADYGGKTGPEPATALSSARSGLVPRPRYTPWSGNPQNKTGLGREELMNELDKIRQRLGATLRNELSDTAVNHLERRVNDYNAAFRVGTSGTVMVDVARDVQEAHELLDGTHTPDIQRRLLEVLARLSGMLGIALMHLGDVRAAGHWFNMAELAAEQAGDRELRAWVSVRQSLVPLYYGNDTDALGLATQALNLAGPRRVTVAGARAEVVRARVLARTPGQRSAALAAADHAQAIHAELSEADTTDGILGLTTAQLAGHLGEVYTRLGDTRRAFDQQSVVLSRLTGTSPEGCLEPDGCLDVTLTRLQQALCHVHDGEPERACVEAARALLAIPEICCAPMVTGTAREVAAAVPATARSTNGYTELRDVLAFRQSH